jgi:hypothetical protein
MSDLLEAAKAVCDQYDYTGTVEECEAVNRLIAAVERAEKQEAVGYDDWLNAHDVCYPLDRIDEFAEAAWIAAQQAERERCRKIVIAMGGPDVPELLRQIDSGED